MIHHIMLGKISIASRISANTEYLNDGNSILYSNDEELLEILKDIDNGGINENDYKDVIKECQNENFRFLFFFLLHPGLFATVQPVLNQVIQLFLSERFCNQINVSLLLFRMKDRG